MHLTAAEVETTFRWDDEDRSLWASTTRKQTAARWKRMGFPVEVLGRKGEEERSWGVKVPWDGTKRSWTRLFSASIPQYKVGEGAATEPELAPEDDAMTEDEEIPFL